MTLFELVAKLSLDSSGYESGLDDAEKSANGIGSKIGKGLSTATKVGAAAITAATGATVAFSKSAVDAGMQFDSSMSQVAATMGTTVDQIDNLRNFAMEMGASTVFSASEAADALNYMALAGYDAETSMEMLPSVLNLAVAGGIDLASASDMVTDSQSALGLTLEETAEMVDQMAKASSKSNTSVQQLGDAFLTIGATARNIKGGTVELSSVLGVLADNGIKGAEGGTHLRNILLSLQKPSKDGTAALEQLGMTYADMYDEAGNMRDLPGIFLQMQRAMEGMDQASRDAIVRGVFNSTDLAAVNALIGTSVNRWGELETAISNASGVSAETAAENLRSVVDWSQYAGEAWMSMKDSTEEALQGLSAQILYNLHEQGLSVAETADFIASEYDMSMADAEAAVKSVEESLKYAKGAAQEMADTQSDNLTGDIKAFGSALEGTQIILSDNLTPTLREFVQLGTQGLSDITAGFNENGIEGAMEGFSAFVSNGIEMISSMLPQCIEVGVHVLEAITKGLADNVPMLADAAVSIARSLVDSIITLAPTVAEGGIGLLSEVVNGIGQALPEVIPAAFQAVFTFANSLLDNADAIVDSAVNLMVGLGEGLINSIPIILENTPKIIEALVQALIKAIPKIGEAGGKLLRGLAEGFPKAVPQILKAVGSIIGSIVEAILGGATAIFSAGADLIGGLGKGIIDGAKGVIENAKKVAGDVLGAIKGFFGIASPSKVMRDQVGKQLVAGISEGIEDELGTVEKSTDKLSWAISDGLKEGVNGELGSIKNTTDKLAWAVSDGLSNVSWSLGKDSKSIKETANDLAWAISDGVNGSLNNVSWSLDESSGIISGFSDGLRKGLQDSIDGFVAQNDTTKKISSLASSSDFSSLSASSVINNTNGLSSSSSSMSNDAFLDKLIDVLRDMGVMIDGKALVGHIAPYIDSELGRMMTNEEREAAYI